MKKTFLLLSVVIAASEIFAQEKRDTLSTVTVVARKPAIRVMSDKTVIDVDASPSNSGSNALELLEKSPGITFDKNGNISIKGRSGTIVMIDGKPVQLSGEELTNLLSSMTSAQLQTIEIIDNPSAKFDAAGNAGIINIKTKKNTQRGFNGNLNLQAAQGRYNRTLNTINLNYFSGKVNLFGTIGANIQNNFTDMYAFRKYYEEHEKTVTSMLEQPSFFKARVPSQNIKAGLDYHLSKKTTLGLVLSGNNFRRRTSGNNKAFWMNAEGLQDSVISTSTEGRVKLQNGTFNLNARHAISGNEEITADVDLIQYRLSNEQSFQNITDSYTESIRGSIPASINILTAKADYHRRLSDGTLLEAGWKSSQIKTDNSAAYFYALNNGTEEPDFGKTHHFLYEERIHALYLSSRKQMDKWNVQGGIRYEKTGYDAHQLGNAVRKDSSFSRRYDGLFPTVTISLDADSLNSFSLTAGRRIDRPPFQKLNPFVFLINKYTYQAGNPYYRPQYTWNAELSHTFKNIFITSLNYSLTDDYFSQIFYVDSSGIITYTEGNLDRMQNLGLTVSAQVSPTRWWSLVGQATVNHKMIKGFVWQSLHASLTQFNMNISNQFSFGKGWAFELSGFMQLREQELQEITDPTGQLIAGLSKSLLKGRATLKCAVRDIFYTQAMKGNTIFKQATEYFSIQRDSRSASIAFSYRFGKAAKALPARRGGAEEEWKRANTAS